MTANTIDIAKYQIPGSSLAYYIPNFVTLEEEEYLIRKILESPQQQWKKLQNRRLQILGGSLSSKGVLLPQDLPPYISKFPDIVDRIRATGVFQSSPHGAPNHVILNEYLPGQGIMPHEDGPSYHPVVATLSLGSHAVFHYYRYKLDNIGDADDPTPESSPRGRVIDQEPVLSVLLEPRSLVITTSELYTAHLHGIDEIAEDVFPSGADGSRLAIANFDLLADLELKQAVLSGKVLQREPRYSLTCRDVAKVATKLSLGRR